MISGYLSQRMSGDEDCVEIIAKHIWLDHPKSFSDQANKHPDT